MRGFTFARRSLVARLSRCMRSLGTERRVELGPNSRVTIWTGGPEMISPYSSKKNWGVCLQKSLQILGGILGVLLLCLPAFSQGSFGRILGTVFDQSGGVISGATVTVLDKDRGISRPLTTDDAGVYNAPSLA